MDYIAVYTAVLDHPKALALSDRAFRVLVSAWLYAGRHDTAGCVPATARRVIRMTDAAALELEQAGWLHRNGTGWEIHQWEEHQENLSRALAARESSRQRKASQRKAERERRAAGAT